MRDAGRDERIGEVLARGNAHPAAVVEVGALALLGGEHLVRDRVVDDAGNYLAFALQPDGDGEQRHAVQEVGGAVERVDDPAMGLVVADDLAALLHQEAVAGARLRQLAVDDLLGLVVGGGDEVARALDRNLQLLDLAEVAGEAAAGLAGGGDHDVHQR